jgi:hypothetical protein
MSMPTIPKEPYRPNRKEVAIDLLESIALEEIALSHIMNAEAEKIQAFVGKDLNFPTHPKSGDIIKFNKEVNRLLETIVMKEWLLLKKLENVLDFIGNDKNHDDDESSSCEIICKDKHDCEESSSSESFDNDEHECEESSSSESFDNDEHDCEESSSSESFDNDESSSSESFNSPGSIGKHPKGPGKHPKGPGKHPKGKR